MHLVLAAALALAQAQPAPTGKIEGTIFRTGSNEPLAGVRVTLTRRSEADTGTNMSNTNLGSTINLFQVPPIPTGTGSTSAPTTMPPMPVPPLTTDSAGKFSFSGLEAGTFILSMFSDGYVKQIYGQKVLSGSGTPITLTAGEVLKDLTIQLIPTGNVSGRLVDNLGKPAVGVPLLLLRAVYNQAGTRSFQQAGNLRTNNRGEYSFYWATPGRYYVAAGSPQGPPGGGAFFVNGGAASPNESEDTYAFTYYPGTSELTRATVIDLRPGGDVVADFMVPKQQLYTIRGRIVDPAAAVPPLSASLALAFQSLIGTNTMFSRKTIYIPSTGMFELREIVPGPYILFANTAGGSARAPVEVVNANVEGVVLSVNTGLTINGRVSVEGGTLPSTGVRIQFRPTVGGSTSLVGSLPTNQNPAPDGTFQITNVLPGQYRIVPPTLPELYVKQIRFDRADALNQAVNVEQRGQDAPTLDVVFSANVSQIEGVASNSKMQPAAGVQVVLIPDTNRDRIDLYKTARADQTGRFTLRGIAPGDYKLFAWEDIEPFMYFDPEFVRKAEPSAKAVHVSESSKLSADVQVIAAN
jgi:hypothetical protein